MYFCSVTKQTLENNLPEIRDYARLLRTGVTSVNRANVYFCGQPETGKTTLSRALASLPITYADESSSLKMRTRGIDVLPVKTESGTEYSFWDFAGQADYHVHHDLFITLRSSLFVLLVDARLTEDERREHGMYWMRYIMTQCPPGVKPKVLVLATHIDERGADLAGDLPFAIYLGLLLEDLKDVFGECVTFLLDEVLPINCRDVSSDGMATLKKELDKAHALICEELGPTTPVICQRMIDVLGQQRASRTRFLTWAAFERAMEGVSTDSSLVSLAAQHLHKIGEVYYGTGGPLRDIVILDLPWLCHEVLGWLFCPLDMLEAHDMTRLVKFRKLAEAGAVDVGDIPIVHAFEGTVVQTLDVLEAFELCFSSSTPSGGRAYIFPSLLRTSAPTGIWQDDPMLDCHIGLQFSCAKKTIMIPPGLFKRIQLRVVQGIGQPQLSSEKEAIYEDGIIRRVGPVQVRMQLSRDGRSIFVHVRGPKTDKRECRRMLQRIVVIVQRASERSSGLELDVLHSNSGDLRKYVAEPQTFEQEMVYQGRVKGRKFVLMTSGPHDDLTDLLAIDPECMC